MSLLAPWRSRNTIWDEMNQFRQQMDRVFGGIVNEAPLRLGLAVSYPAVNVREDEDFVHVESELPGIKLDDLEISIAGPDLLLLKGTHKPTEPAQAAWYHHERPRGSFERAIKLPTSVDSQKIEARLEEGVLSIQMGKSADAKPIKIVVKTE